MNPIDVKFVYMRDLICYDPPTYGFILTNKNMQTNDQPPSLRHVVDARFSGTKKYPSCEGLWCSELAEFAYSKPT